MLTKSRLIVTTAFAVAAIGTSPALAMPAPGEGTSDPRQQDMHASTVVKQESATVDARGEHSAALSETAPATASDVRGEFAASEPKTAPALASDVRGEFAASEPTTAPALASDQRTPDAREPFVRPVVVEVGDPVPGGFDWPAAIIGLAGGLALAVLAGVGVAGARRRPVRPSVS